MMTQYNLQSEPDTFALIVNGRCYTMSNAVLKVASQLSGPWPLMQALFIFPKRFRDFIYVAFGRNRYRWFGKLDQCVVPTADIRSRFVGDQEA